MKKSVIIPEMAAGRLESAGMSAEQARHKAQMLERARRSLEKLGVDFSGDWWAFFVPGRVECLGKHTDYGGGRSMVCAVERGFVLLVSARGDKTVRAVDAASEECVEFVMSGDLEPTMGHWSNYAMTVCRRLERNFSGELRGADIAFISDLPAAAGMSSSSALIIGFFLALEAVNSLAEQGEYLENIDSAESLAGYLGTIENGQSFGSLTGSRGVGTFGGSQDHTAILCCKAGKLSCFLYCPARLEKVIALPGELVLAVGSSGVVAAKTGEAREKYNRASALVSVILEVWNGSTGREDLCLFAALASSGDAEEQMRGILGQADQERFSSKELVDRFEHFVAESGQILPAAREALSEGRLGEFGREVDRSQELTETLLGNQVPQTIFLAHSARELGAVAASAFGAGFGGAVWAMIRQDEAEQFVEDWSKSYEKAYPEQYKGASFFITRPGPAAMCIQSSQMQGRG